MAGFRLLICRRRGMVMNGDVNPADEGPGGGLTVGWVGGILALTLASVATYVAVAYWPFSSSPADGFHNGQSATVGTAGAKSPSREAPASGGGPADVDELQQLGMVIGAVYDERAGQLYLVGDGRHVDASPTRQQIAVALRWAVADHARGNFVSIDPWPDNPDYDWMQVALNDDAQDTDFGWLMFEADRLLKSYSLGVDSITRAPLRSSIPGFRSLLDLHLAAGGKSQSAVWSRFWLYPRATKAEVSASALRLGDVSIGVRTETMRRGGSKLVPAPGGSDKQAENFAAFASEHYDALANEAPVFRQLEQLLRLLLVGEWVRTQRIPVDLDAIERATRSTFRVPHVTSALRVSRISVDTAARKREIRTVKLFGGVDFQHVRLEVVADRGDFAAWQRAALEAAQTSETGAARAAVDARAYRAVPIAAGVRRRSRRLDLLVELPLPHAGVLRLFTGRGANHDRGGFSLWLPVLRAYNPDGRDGRDRTFEIQGIAASRVPVRHYELSDADGTLLGRFSEHEIEQSTARVVVRPTERDNRWQLYPQADGVVWANGPAGRTLAFDAASGTLVGEQVGDDIVRYHYRPTGALDRITVEDDGSEQVLIRFEHGSNGRALLRGVTPNGRTVTVREGGGTADPRRVVAYNEGRQSFSVTVDAATGDWRGADGAPGLDYLDRHAGEIGRMLADRPRVPGVIADGGFTLLVTPSAVHDLPVAVHSPASLERAVRAALPEDHSMIGIQRASGARTMVLSRTADGFALDAVAQGEPVQRITGPDAQARYEDVERQRLAAASTDDLRFLHVTNDGADVVLQLGTVQQRIPNAEFERLAADPESSAPSPLDALFTGAQIPELVVFRSAVTRYLANATGSNIDPSRVAAILSRRYRAHGIRVYLDDEPRAARRNRDALPVLNGPQDVAALFDDAHFRGPDLQLVRNIRTLLTNTGISVTARPNALEDVPTVLMITGHNDAELVTYLQDLGRQGVLRDRVILLNTCYASANADFFHELIAQYGALAVLHHGDSILTLALQDVFAELRGLWADAARNGHGIHPADLLAEAASRALRNPNHSERQRSEIGKLLNAVLQISRAPRRYPHRGRTITGGSVYG